MQAGLLRTAVPRTTAQYLISLATAQAHQRLITGMAQRITKAEVAEQAAEAVEVFMRAFAPESPAHAAALP